MRARGLAAAALLAAACSTSASQADNDALCSALAADLKAAALGATPSQVQAAAAAGRLDARVTQVADPGLHDAVVRLHQHLHDIDLAWRKRGPADVARATARARDDAKKAARACKLSPDAFLGG